MLSVQEVSRAEFCRRCAVLFAINHVTVCAAFSTDLAQFAVVHKRKEEYELFFYWKIVKSSGVW